MIVESLDGFKWLVERDDHKLVLNDGEMSVRTILYKLARKREVFVDVGAHVGEYTIRMAKVYKRIYAFEPNPYTFHILVKNVELNDISVEKISLYNLACGDEKGWMELKLRGGSSTFLNIGEKSQSRRVQVVRLDDMVERADVIKIDVEGWEEKVVLGAMGLIKRCRPILIIEHHEYREYKGLEGTRERIQKMLPDYISLNINNVHWLHAPRETPLEEIKDALVYHWFNKCVKNLEEGKPWYYGIPYTWWYGASLIDFLLALPKHITREKEWIEKI